MTRRFQFSLKALLMATLIVAAFFGGMAVQKSRDAPTSWGSQSIGPSVSDGKEIDAPIQFKNIQMQDGTRWYNMPHDKGKLRLWSEPGKYEDGKFECHMRLPDGTHWQMVDKEEPEAN